MSDQPSPSPYAVPPQPMSPQDEKLWATLTHIGGILFYWVAPLVAYLVLRDRGPFIRQHTAAALNFQLTMLIGWVAGFVLSFVGIGLLVIIAAGVLVVVFSIIAAVAANNGQYYRYPIAIEFVH
jgi:uncharacterized Tic20 family protein